MCNFVCAKSETESCRLWPVKCRQHCQPIFDAKCLHESAIPGSRLALHRKPLPHRVDTVALAGVLFFQKIRNLEERANISSSLKSSALPTAEAAELPVCCHESGHTPLSPKNGWHIVIWFFTMKRNKWPHRLKKKKKKLMETCDSPSSHEEPYAWLSLRAPGSSGPGDGWWPPHREPP